MTVEHLKTQIRVALAVLGRDATQKLPRDKSALTDMRNALHAECRELGLMRPRNAGAAQQETGA